MKTGGYKMANTTGLVVAIVMAAVLLLTGAAAEIIGAFSSAFGWTLGGLMGVCIVLAIIFASMDNR